MTNGLPTPEYMSFDDARQFLACGQTVSQHPTWLCQEELDLAPLKEQCQRELQAAADKDGSYPLAASDLDGSPASIVAALDQHRQYWTRSCPALYDGEVAAGVARLNKEERLRDAERRLIDALRTGELPFYGVSIGRNPQFELIHPSVGTMHRDVEEGEIEFHGNDMFTRPAGLPGVALRHLYRGVVTEGRAFIDWAGRAGTDTNTESEEVPLSDEVMVSSSLDGALASLAEQEVHSNPQTSADPEQVAPDAKARARKRARPKQGIALRVIEELYPSGVPDNLTDKELRRQIMAQCEGLKICIKTIRRALGLK
jgi:hypothetical protein